MKDTVGNAHLHSTLHKRFLSLINLDVGIISNKAWSKSDKQAEDHI